MSKVVADVLNVDPPTKSQKKWIVIVLALLIVLISAAAGTYFLLYKKDEKPDPAEPIKKVAQKALVYLPLEIFVVNLLPEADGDQVFLQIGVNLQVDDNQDVDMIKTHMPQVRSRMLLLLSSQSAKVLETPGGKNQLIADILAELKRPFAKDFQEQKVSNVFFTSFIIQ